MGAGTALIACSASSPHAASGQEHRSRTHPPTIYRRASTSEALERRDGTVQTGDKSCGMCKTRKVRCDRTLGQCLRCKKRKETCVYPDETLFEDIPGGPSEVRDQVRFALLESQLATLVERLDAKNAESHPSSLTSLGGQSPSRLLPDLATSILVAVVSGTATETACLHLSEYFRDRSGVPREPSGADGTPSYSELGRKLAGALIHAFHDTCWSKLPSFQPLTQALAPYDYSATGFSLDTMEPAAQVAMVVLCALGASCKPRSGVFGTPLDLTIATLGDIAQVGAKREHACRRLGDLAWDVAGRVGLFWDGTPSTGSPNSGHPGSDPAVAIGVLLGWSQWLTFEEVNPVRSRWLLRNVLSLFEDIEGAGEALKVALGPDIMALDSTISSKLLTPSLVTPALSHDFLRPAPDAPMAHSFAQVIDKLARNQNISKSDISFAIAATTRNIGECHARFTSVAVQSRGSVPKTVFQAIQFLWETIDDVHASVQKLQHVLAGIQYTPAGCEGDVRALDDFILLAVRLDMYLIDLCNSIHAFVGRAQPTTRGGERELAEMKFDSERRVRKCLRLVAFYSQFFLSSGDKYLGSHLIIQLNLLPEWTQVATQRVGAVGGPTSQEFEVSEEELDWLVAALRSACFFAIAPTIRLAEMAKGRGQSPSVYPYLISPTSDGVYLSPDVSLSSESSPATSGSLPRPSPTEYRQDYFGAYPGLSSGDSSADSMAKSGALSNSSFYEATPANAAFQPLPPLNWMDFAALNDFQPGQWSPAERRPDGGRGTPSVDTSMMDFDFSR